MNDLEALFSKTEFPDYLTEGNFDKATKVHDWRNYVPGEMQASWSELTDRERKIIYLMANEQARAENWE